MRAILLLPLLLALAGCGTAAYCTDEDAKKASAAFEHCVSNTNAAGAYCGAAAVGTHCGRWGRVINP